MENYPENERGEEEYYEEEQYEPYDDSEQENEHGSSSFDDQPKEPKPKVRPAAPIQGGLKGRIKNNAMNKFKGLRDMQRVRNTAVATTNAIAATKSAIGTIIGIIFNPVSLTILAVIALILAVIFNANVAMLTLGSNENADACFGDSSSTAQIVAESSDDVVKQRNTLAAWLTSTNFRGMNNQPLSIEQAAGILGNLQQESGLKPDLPQGTSGLTPTTPNNQILALGTVSGKAIGLAQWDGDRRPGLVNYANSKGVHWSDMNMQLEYFKKEMDEYQYHFMITKSTFFEPGLTPKEYTLQFEKGFERAGKPNMENRYKFTEQAMQTLDIASAVTTGGGCFNQEGGVGEGIDPNAPMCSEPVGDVRAVYSNGKIPNSALCSIREGTKEVMQPEAARAFLAMNEAYKAHFGKDICITDSYRSYAEQVDVKRRKPNLAATPGTSNHGWGYALDLGCGINSFGSPQHKWMQANAGRFDFLHPSWAKINGSMPEPWHWEHINA